MFDKEFWEHLKADNYYALKLGTLKWLAIGFFILFILNMLLWRLGGTGIFHILIGSDPAYDGGPGWGSAPPVRTDPEDPNILSCYPVYGDKICGGSGFNASAVMLILAVGFSIGYVFYEKPKGYIIQNDAK